MHNNITWIDFTKTLFIFGKKKKTTETEEI